MTNRYNVTTFECRHVAIDAIIRGYSGYQYIPTLVFGPRYRTQLPLTVLFKHPFILYMSGTTSCEKGKGVTKFISTSHFLDQGRAYAYNSIACLLSFHSRQLFSTSSISIGLVLGGSPGARSQ